LYVMRKHRDLANLYGEAPAAIETAIEGFNKQVGVVTAHLRDQTYLLGDHFTGADILLTSVLTWAANYGFSLDPVLQRYMEKQTARSAYKRAAKLNFSISAGG
ncbi:MAG: glutathione S-transferase family protein, partial [Pseudomonadota bacterium]